MDAVLGAVDEREANANVPLLLGPAPVLANQRRVHIKPRLGSRGPIQVPAREQGHGLAPYKFL